MYLRVTNDADTDPAANSSRVSSSRRALPGQSLRTCPVSTLLGPPEQSSNRTSTCACISTGLRNDNGTDDDVSASSSGNVKSSTTSTRSNTTGTRTTGDSHTASGKSSSSSSTGGGGGDVGCGTGARMVLNNGMSMSPPVMDGYATRLHEGGSSDSEDQALLQRQQQRQGQDQSLAQSRHPPQGQTQQKHQHQHQRQRPQAPLEFHRINLERVSASNLRSSFRVNANPRPGRSITPDLLPGQGGAASAALSDSTMAHTSRSIGSQQGSPRSVPGSVGRRQGVVFASDVACDSSDGTDSSPATHHQRSANGPSIRPRTRTMDASMLGPRGSSSAAEFRHRVSSISSGSQPSIDDHKTLKPSSDPASYSTIPTVRVPEITTPTSSKEKSKSSHHNRRLLKRQPSRPTSPLVEPQPSVDSFPYPIPTEDANRLISLMKALGGRMRGELEYQGEYQGTWHTGMAYIDEEKGTLMFGLGHTGQNASFHIPLVSDLRGCKVHVTGYPDAERECLEVVPNQMGLELLIRPIISEELELWLAALLCWQQLTPLNLKVPSGKPASPSGHIRPEMRRRAKSSDAARATNIIKVGKFMLWDKGPARSARALVQRSSTRDLLHPAMFWRRISCVLQDNGEFRLLMENDVSVLSSIELSQLSRCAIQGLDRSVLGEEYCIAIFPIYASNATHVTIFRPIYLAVDSRIDFEVWFALLRTFAVPDIFCLDDPQTDEIQDVVDIEKDQPGEVFRMEKIVRVRVIEAKIKANPSGPEWFSPERYGRVGPDPLVGCYLAEVILDGEVRARTTTKMDTKNPFWREDCEFNDLPPIIQDLSVVLKRVESGPDGYSKPMTSQEIICGSVKIALNDLERGQGQEQWWPILDEKQQNIGSMLIKVFHDEHVALLSKEYEPLSEVLHRFPTGLTTLISASLPGQLRLLSELFLNIFQASGSASDWLMALVEDEIDGIGNQTSIKKYRFSNRLKSSESLESSNERELMVRDIHRTLAGEANLLFRGNSLLTQSLEFHMRRLGKEYLEEILMDKLCEINELNPDCEVDPSKLAHTGADLDHHWGRLIHLTTEIWLCIADSAERIPAELRHILKYIRAVADDRYSDFLRTVSYTSISGFLFLRFICPAILSPKLFGLLRDHPKPQAQRTLTLIAKALQKLSNLSTFGKREEYMEPMNRFLTQQRQSFRGFIDHVCSIPADRTGRALPPSYITPVTILNRLGPTAREGFPSLPYLIDQARSYASLVKLWVDARPIDAKHLQADGELLVFNDLCFGLQKRADACLAKVVDFRNREVPSYMSADQLAEILEQVNFTGPYHPYYPGSPSSMPGNYEQPPGSSSSDGDTKQNRRSKEWKRGRDDSDTKKGNSPRTASGSASGSTKQKNGKVGRTLLSGIMKIGGGRAESPETKGQR